MRWTKAKVTAFRRAWLLERMGHRWSDSGRTVCTQCGAKFGPGNARRPCPKRKKPNRWRVHFSRALHKAQYGQTEPVKRTPGWMLQQLAAIRRAVNRDPRFEEDLRYWKYHRLARRYRRIMRDWWSLPGAALPVMAAETSIDTFGAYMTRGRNRLIEQAQREQSRVVVVDGTIYTFKPDAQWRGRFLFQDETGDHGK